MLKEQCPEIYRFFFFSMKINILRLNATVSKILVLIIDRRNSQYCVQAPNPEELHKETVRKVKDLHKFDCLRANKSTMAWGLEAR